MDTNPNTVEFDILVAKIEKMWRRANHPNTPEAEAEVAKTKALALMEQHRIEMSMLALADDDVLGDHFYGEIKGSYGLVYNAFVDAVARAFDCRTWWTNRGMTYRLYVSGYESDFRRVVALANFLLNDAVAQAAQFTSSSKAITKDYRRSFVQSYGYEISRRLKEAKKVAHDDAVAKIVNDDAVHGRHYIDNPLEAAEARVAGAELVLAQKAQRVADHMKSKRLRTVGHKSGRSANGSANGRIAGANADLSGGRNRMGGGTKALGR